jgi:hypothetical protein
LADGDRTDTGHHLALWQVTVADDALVAVLGLQIGMLAEKVCNLGLYRLGKQGTRSIAQGRRLSTRYERWKIPEGPEAIDEWVSNRKLPQCQGHAGLLRHAEEND